MSGPSFQNNPTDTSTLKLIRFQDFENDHLQTKQLSDSSWGPPFKNQGFQNFGISLVALWFDLPRAYRPNVYSWHAVLIPILKCPEFP